MSLDDYRRGQNAEIENLIKEVGDVVASAKSVAEFSEKLFELYLELRRSTSRLSTSIVTKSPRL